MIQAPGCLLLSIAVNAKKSIRDYKAKLTKLFVFVVPSGPTKIVFGPLLVFPEGYLFLLVVFVI